MMNIKIKTTDLDNITEKLESEIKTLHTILERAKTNGNSLVDSWQSPSQEILSSKFRNFSNEFERFYEDLSVFPAFLHYVSANYTNVDRETEDKLDDFIPKQFDFESMRNTLYAKDAGANYVVDEKTSPDNISDDVSA